MYRSRESTCVKPYQSMSIAESCGHGHQKTLPLYQAVPQTANNNYATPLSGLTKLDFSRLGLHEIPREAYQMIGIKCLILDDNKILELPKNIFCFRKLKEFSIMNNGLEEMPNRMDKFVNLTKINLSNNRVAHLSPRWEGMKSLKELDLSRNLFTEMPRSIVKGICHLEILDISENKNINMSDRVWSTNLRKFTAQDCGTVDKFPTWICSGKYSKIEVLNFRSTKFNMVEVPEDAQCVRVKSLNLQGCGINQILLEKLLKLFTNVERLMISNDQYYTHMNTFQFFPINCLQTPYTVTELDLRYVGLSVMPDSIYQLVNLKFLNMENNYLTVLPEEICYLKHLEVLNVNNNMLVMLPDNLKSCVGLRVILAAHNHISLLPPSIHSLKNLMYLDLYNNEFSALPEELATLPKLRGLDLELNFLETVDISTMKINHEVLRRQMRNYYTPHERRDLGPKSTSNPTTDVSSTESETYESDTSLKYHSGPVSISEDWDDKYAWTNEFDPYNPPTVDTPYIRVYTYYSEDFLCPADLHPPSVRQEFSMLRANGKLKKFPSVPGQFDDAD